MPKRNRRRKARQAADAELPAVLERKRRRDQAEAIRKAGVGITARHGRLLSLAMRQAARRPSSNGGASDE